MAMDMALIYEPKAAHAEEEMLCWWEQGQLPCRRIAQLQHSGDVSVSSVALSIHRIIGVGKDLWRSSITLLATLCAECHSPSQPPGHTVGSLATCWQPGFLRDRDSHCWGLGKALHWVRAAGKATVGWAQCSGGGAGGCHLDMATVCPSLLVQVIPMEVKKHYFNFSKEESIEQISGMPHTMHWPKTRIENKHVSWIQFPVSR